MGIRFHPPRLLAAGSVLLLACSTPTDMCACPPARTHVVAHGVVSTAAGEPVPGAEIRASLFRAACGEGPAEPAEPGGGPARTDAAGQYEGRFFSVRGPAPACLRVVAVRPGGDSVAAGGAAVALRSERQAPERVRVDLVFP